MTNQRKVYLMTRVNQCYSLTEQLEIYIRGQVNTLSKKFKLSYSSKSSTVADKLFQILTMRFPRNTF